MTAERMVILVTGDRNWDATQAHVVQDVLQDWQEECPIIVHGAARGVDTLAGEAAEALGYTVHPYPARWSRYGKAAGPRRNTEMLEERPNLVFAFHDDLVSSKGTRNMVNQAVKAGVQTIQVMSNGKRRRITAQVKGE